MADKTDKPKRADAERTITAVLDAALRCFAGSPDATVTEIAKAAGVGRVTVYGHFDSLESIVDALLVRSLAEADATFSALDLESGTAAEAVDRLLHAPWLLGRYQGLLGAATRHLGPEKVRRLHDQVFARIEAVVVRGRESGEFRTDLPLPWVMASVYALAHAAAGEADAGRLGREQAADLLSTTMLGLLRGPGGTGAS
ncbi:TetR/AcrR family transcriptional repressor of mexCD-oprJ operon [Catenulispora sp. GP43]|uniref:TetR/AcrR family transcriptional regulator n=1 Tax=Catenulispora sp. GP43 TaxID=3156263 RepID=UPI003518D07A